jgi:hypothetical protein
LTRLAPYLFSRIRGVIHFRKDSKVASIANLEKLKKAADERVEKLRKQIEEAYRKQFTPIGKAAAAVFPETLQMEKESELVEFFKGLTKAESKVEVPKFEGSKVEATEVREVEPFDRSFNDDLEYSR